MAKGRKSYRPRKTHRKRKTMGARIAKKMQNAASTYVKQKYTTVFPIIVAANADVAQTTISHIGAKNATTTAGTLSLTDCNPDQKLFQNMQLYQYFKITGVAFKVFFPEGTTPEATPISWSMGYSQNEIIRADLAPERLQTLGSYQTSSCSAQRPISRYFKTGTALKRLGVDWAQTKDISQWAAGGGTTYGGQLAGNLGSSTNIKVMRASTAISTENQVGRIQLSYYVTYKGPKGLNGLS